MPEHNLNDQVISQWREGWAGTLAPDALVDVFERPWMRSGAGPTSAWDNSP